MVSMCCFNGPHFSRPLPHPSFFLFVFYCEGKKKVHPEFSQVTSVAAVLRPRLSKMTASVKTKVRRNREKSSLEDEDCSW